MHHLLVGLLVCGISMCASVSAQQQQDAKPPKPTPESVWRLPEKGRLLSVKARCGKVGGQLQAIFGPAGRERVTLTVRCQDMPKLGHHWKLTKVEQDLKDAALTLRLTGNHGWQRRVERSYFIRPDVHFYVGDDFKNAVQQWSDLPPASEHWFRLDVARRRGRVEVTIDGRYFSSFPVPATDEMDLSFKGGAELGTVTTPAAPESARFVPVDISANPHRGPLAITRVPLKPGLRDVSGIPMNVTPPDAVIDMGLARWLRQNTGGSGFYDPYYRRTAWDGVPETIMFSVPRRSYNRVHVLCAVESNPKESPSMSVRLARYRQVWDGGGGTQADTTVVIDPENPKGCLSLKKVGSVQAETAGTEHDLDLYLAEIPLKAGELADYLQMTEMTGKEAPDFFYLELTRELRTRVTANYSRYEKKPLGPPSSLHILGVTLEKAPVEIVVGSEAVGNVFYIDATPQLQIAVNNPSASAVRLRMESCLTDFYGNEHPREAELTFPHGKTAKAYDLGHLQPGWYRARFTFSSDGRALWEQPLTLALLPPDTRKVGAESPYGTWWFARSHYCEPQADKVLPLVRKMGFWHVTPRDRKPDYGHTPEDFARHHVTPSMMRRMKERPNSPPVEEQAVTFMGDWPDTRYAMIFHETGGLPFGLAPPPELLGKEAPEFTGKDLDKEKELLEHIERHASAIRKAAPNAKIILGNSVTNFNVHWLRKKLPRKYWDYIGAEMAVQLFRPEGQPHGWNLQGLWIAKRMCEIYGYDDVPITSCYEFDYRPTAPGALSLRDQADWYTRDVLHCLAYRLPNINVGLLFDVDSAYYFSRWGSTGVCFRSPLMMPKPSYVALATLTRMLDQARYQRYLDTGSHALYCLEFEKQGGMVYALWTTTGERDVQLVLNGGTDTCTLVDLMGREETLPVRDGKLQITASESPCYVVVAQPLQSVAAGRVHHEGPTLEDSRVIDKLHAGDWQIVATGDEKFRDYCPYKPLTEAKCSLAPGKDGGLKLTLHLQAGVPDIVGRYVVLAPKREPIAVVETANTLGAWVNGNTNWGRLIFQVEDADGNLYSSVSLGGWDVSDWRGRTRINHDGWRFIANGFPLDYASGHHGLDSHNWSRLAEMKQPVKVTRLYVIMREKLVYVTDMVRAKSMSIELKDLTTGRDTAKLPAGQ